MVLDSLLINLFHTAFNEIFIHRTTEKKDQIDILQLI